MSELAAERIAERLGLEPALSRDDFEAILGSVSEGVAVRTPDGKIVYANDAAAALLGQPSELFDITGRPLDPADLPDERARVGGDE